MDRLTENIGNFAYTYSGTQKTTKEYDKWVFEATCKLGKLEDLEEQIGCPLDIVFKLAEQDELYVQFCDELQHHKRIKVDIKNKVVWFCKQTGGHYACKYPLFEYGKMFWLKPDRSE